MKQLSIFLENKQGTLIQVLNLLKEANIQIVASTVADTAEYGIYRVICDNTEQAYIILKENGIAVNLTEVNSIELDDTPGAAANAISKLVEEGVNIAYLYSFLLNGKGMLVYRKR
jgi:hypothetical protein